MRSNQQHQPRAVTPAAGAEPGGPASILPKARVHYGADRALARLGASIGPYDVLVAAQARRAGAILVTANGREFERIPGLKVADWAA